MTASLRNHIHRGTYKMKEIKRGEIYYADLYDTVGSEESGIRPVLILQNDIGNTIIAPITSRRQHSAQPTHVNIDTDGLAKKSTVMLEQIRTIDISRLDEYIGRLDKFAMAKVDRAIIVGLGIKCMEEILR